MPAPREPGPAPTMPPSGDVIAIEPITAAVALAAGALVILFGLLLRKVLRRGRSGVGL